MNRLQHKVAIVTGAAGGIGEAIARTFAREGCKVLATDIQGDKLKDWAEKAGIAHMVHDVSSADSWHKVVQKASALYGKIDILVNNAGIYRPMETTESLSLERWNTVLAVDLSSVFLGAQAALPFLKQSGGKAAIVNISSIAGMVGGNGAAYSAAKAGVRLLSKDQAIEFAPFGIRVNSIHPGGVLTPMVTPLLPPDPTAVDAMMQAMCPMGRIGQPEEIANGALFLASDEASYITGAELVIDGGMTAR